MRNSALSAKNEYDTLAAPADFDAAFDRSFSLVAFAVNRQMVDHMLRCSRELGVDYEALVIWGVVAHQNIAHLMPPGSLPSKVLTDRGVLPSREGAALRPLRLRDVAQITGIARETARRKLRRLAEIGWLEETTDGWVVAREKSVSELREFTRESARRLLISAQEVARILRDGEVAADASKDRAA